MNYEKKTFKGNGNNVTYHLGLPFSVSSSRIANSHFKEQFFAKRFYNIIIS